ncbi:hypothetical protein ACFOSS_02825 [Pseudaeromonas sharmana]|uniref:Uncharacterized protein n=1 Tax=Pseudaeromonas sharmana TaxID=328412 RepID=A0ABV8CK55_9GAMM
MSAATHQDPTAGSDDLQAAIAVNHLLSDDSLAPEQAIERLADINLQIQLAVSQLWDRVDAETRPEQLLSLTRIEELVFWRPQPHHAPITIEQAIRLAKLFLLRGGFFNNMLGEGTWLFDEERRPLSLGTELTRDLFTALRPILVLHPLDFDSARIDDFRTDDESYPGHHFRAGELSVWGLRGQVPKFIETARLSMMELDNPFANLPDLE